MCKEIMKTADGIMVPRSLLRPAFYCGDFDWYITSSPRLLKRTGKKYPDWPIKDWLPIKADDVDFLNEEVDKYYCFRNELGLQAFMSDVLMAGQISYARDDYIFLDEDVVFFCADRHCFYLPEQIKNTSFKIWLIYPREVIVDPEELGGEELSKKTKDGR